MLNSLEYLLPLWYVLYGDHFCGQMDKNCEIGKRGGLCVTDLSESGCVKIKNLLVVLCT